MSFHESEKGLSDKRAESALIHYRDQSINQSLFKHGKIHQEFKN